MRTLAIVSVIVLVSLLENVQSAPVTSEDKLKAFKFLTDFGYLANKSSTTNDSSGGSDLFRKGIADLQKFGNLRVTGKLNQKTLQLMSQKRCGLKDPVNKLGRSRDAFGNLKIGEYYLQGTYWKKKHLTYRFKQLTSDLSHEQQKDILRKMINKWADASSLTITEQRDSSVPDNDVDILIRFVRGRHGDPYPFDGPGGTLAHAYYPHSNKGLSGDAHFDDDERFTTGTKDGINLDWVAIHEFGHSLGLEHSNVRESIMYPWYKGYFPNIELTRDDLLGIRALYGTKKPSPTDKKPISTPPPTKPKTAPTPKPDVHPACKTRSGYDAVVVEGDETHFFRGDLFWTLTRNRRTRKLQKSRAKKVKDNWPHVTTPINAAYRNKRGNVVFFAGSRVWEYNNRRQLQTRTSGSLKRYGLTSELANMDAVFTWQKNKKTYIFKGRQYWRYDEEKGRQYRRYGSGLDPGYPRSIKAGWPDFPNAIDAALTWVNGRSYVFKGDQYFRLKTYPENRKVYVDRGYPKYTSDKWMNCNVGAIGAIGTLNADPIHQNRTNRGDAH